MPLCLGVALTLILPIVAFYIVIFYGCGYFYGGADGWQGLARYLKTGAGIGRHLKARYLKISLKRNEKLGCM